MTSILLNGAGALISTALVVAAASVTANAIFTTTVPATPGYEIAVGDAPATVTEEAAPKTLSELLASADASAGQAVFRRCAVCHDASAGGPNKVGPNLYGIIGRPMAEHEGFAYSEAMKSYADGGKTWTFEELNNYLTNPKDEIPGNKMAFAGLRRDEDRANLLAWLNAQSEEPQPLP
ncbi:cytochrome c family protein [Rhizobiaceae bacterium BDR2-2]|uniref:Cytochrome c family protein n=1 Tax=Ectorhizobium quercum TaxID=2965071 RepID=A0AAE3MWD9_9HYPH|nr:cytochrome c family protein [Ectorhizobium quercum]MCX8995621.1 cytochrome c family protein [Ectorhizobium quercum]